MRGDLALLPMWYVAFLLSTTVHEASHALVGKKMGDHTAEDQITINPLPHIQREPVGTVVVPLLSYVLGGWMLGWASAPFDPYWRVRYPHRGAWVALAGPMSNLILAVIAGVCIHIGLASGVFTYPYMLSFSHLVSAADPGVWEGAALFVSILFSLNILLFAFNLIPLPPLDGSKIVGSMLPLSQANAFERLERYGPLILIALIYFEGYCPNKKVSSFI